MPNSLATRFRLAAAACMAFLAYAKGQETPNDDSPLRPGWKLTFHDEFDGRSIDTAKWNLRDPWGAERNRELQAYVDDAFEVRGRVLRIQAERRNARYDGKDRTYTSGMMTTYQKFRQKYGRFEIRCRVPKGKGLWPAFWLLPEPLGWPPEIDVLEVLGDDTHTMYFTHHWREPRGAHKSDHGKYKSDADFANDFHVILIEWAPEEIRWQVDGHERFRSAKSIPQSPMYLLINLAVGGEWPGAPDEKTKFPATFDIDYVRVYEPDRATK
jgi:beta-glucanase (GH16 family)